MSQERLEYLRGKKRYAELLAKKQAADSAASDAEGDATIAAEGKYTRDNPQMKENPGVFERVGDTIKNWRGDRLAEGLKQKIELPGEAIPIVGPAIRSVHSGIKAASEADGFSDFGRRYWKEQDDAQQRSQQFAQKYPEAAITRGLVSGFVAPGPRAASLVSGSGVLPTLGRYAINVGEDVGMSGVDTALRTGGDLEAAKEAMTDAAKFSGALHGIPATAKLAGRGYARFVAGLPGETLEKYQANRPRINARDEESVINELAGDIEASKGRIDNAEGSLKQDVLSRRDLAKEEFQSNKAASAETEGRDLESMRQWLAQKRGEDEFKADSLRREAVDSTQRKMRDAKQKIGKLSKEAKGQLPDDLELSLPPYKAALRRSLNKGGINGAPAEGADFGKIRDYMSQLEKMGDWVKNEGGETVFVKRKTIPAKEAKKLIQQIDRESQSYYENPAAFKDPGVIALKRMRDSLDRSLKRQSPEYAEAMLPVSKKTRALSEMQDEFGYDGDRMFQRMDNLEDLGRLDRSKTLENFDAEFGGNASQKLAEARNQGRNYEGMGRFLEEQFGGNREFRDSAAKSAFKTKQQEIQEYLASKRSDIDTQKSRISGLGEDSAQAKIRRIGNNPEGNIMARRKIENVAEDAGKARRYYNEAADDLAVQRAMEGTFTRGSRNVNLLNKSLHGAVKFLTGSDRAADGAGSLGAMLGAVSDLAGPKLVKFTIDMQDHIPEGAKRALKAASERGPQAYVVAHSQLLKRDPEYRRLWEQQQSDDQ